MFVHIVVYFQDLDNIPEYRMYVAPPHQFVHIDTSDNHDNQQLSADEQSASQQSILSQSTSESSTLKSSTSTSSKSGSSTSGSSASGSSASRSSSSEYQTMPQQEKPDDYTSKSRTFEELEPVDVDLNGAEALRIDEEITSRIKVALEMQRTKSFDPMPRHYSDEDIIRINPGQNLTLQILTF